MQAIQILPEYTTHSWDIVPVARTKRVREILSWVTWQVIKPNLEMRMFLWEVLRGLKTW
jgi:hypothetical protein